VRGSGESNRRAGPQKVTGLRTIANNVGIDGYGMGLMLEAGMIASHVGSYVGENRRLEEAMLAGTLDVKLVPQGTLAEQIRAGGAGIPAFYTPTGVGTWWPRAKKYASSTGANIYWSARSPRLRAGESLERRPHGQPDLSQNRAQF